MKTGVGYQISTWYQSYFAEKDSLGQQEEKLQQADFSHRNQNLYYNNVIFSLFRTASMSLGLRVEDTLEEHSNYSVWKERMQSIFKEGEV